MLFADEQTSAIGFGICVAVIAVIYLAVQWWLLTYHKDAWFRLNEQERERRTAWRKWIHERDAHRRAQNGKMLDAAGTLLKVFLGRK